VPPTITKPLSNIVSREVQDVEFVCDTDGRPGAAISWYKNGEVIIPSGYFRVCACLPHFHLYPPNQIDGARLRVLGLVQSDEGVYQCVADNEAGSVQSAALLRVEREGR
jgi:hypothetical protein